MVYNKDTKKCEECENEFTRQTTGSKRVSPSLWVKRKFCSIACKYLSQKKATGEKASNYRGGKTKCVDCDVELAQRYSFRNTQRCSSCCRKKEKHFNWKGGITPLRTQIYFSKEYQDWRNSVFTRDNYTCVWCGDNTGGNLNADHIKPFAMYPELRFDVNNGRTLCKNCHIKTDTYGYKTVLLMKQNAI